MLTCVFINKSVYIVEFLFLYLTYQAVYIIYTYKGTHCNICGTLINQNPIHFQLLPPGFIAIKNKNACLHKWHWSFTFKVIALLPIVVPLSVFSFRCLSFLFFYLLKQLAQAFKEKHLYMYSCMPCSFLTLILLFHSPCRPLIFLLLWCLLCHQAFCLQVRAMLIILNLAFPPFFFSCNFSYTFFPFQHPTLSVGFVSYPPPQLFLVFPFLNFPLFFPLCCTLLVLTHSLLHYFPFSSLCPFRNSLCSFFHLSSTSHGTLGLCCCCY